MLFWRLLVRNGKMGLGFTESDRETMILSEREDYLNAGFTKEQMEEIDAGRKEKLDVSVYADKNFLPIQMRQIRLGLMEHLPVSVYAKTEFDWFQMEEIREGLKAGVDVSLYASHEISYEKMRQIRKGLQVGINLCNYIRLDAGVIRQLRKALSAGINILKYINAGYDAEQLDEIRRALEKSINPDRYLLKELRAASIAEICKGMENGVDVTLYAKMDYSWRQMREIRKGLEAQIAVEKYSSPLYSWEQMREIRLGLEQGLDVDGYRLLRYTEGEMRKKRLYILEVIYREKERALQSQIKSEDFLFEFVSNDMEAYVTVLAKDKAVTRARLLEILEQNRIRMGILEEAVQKIVSGECGRKPVLIAKGQIPHKGEDGRYEFFFRTNLERKPKVREDGSVDYQNIQWFEMVKEGQKLAVYHEAREGTDGYAVTGSVLKARKGTEQRILTGQGFRISEDRKTYTATMDGMISLEGDEMKITSHMQIDEITMATGNIVFGGSVHILGDVGYGTVVKASGDVVIDGTVEAATIESDGCVVLKKGMNSGGKGMIRAEKDVVSRFFEATKVVAKGNIEVDKCLNSQMSAGGTITSTRVLAGGISQAEQGFYLNNVGNQAGLRTVLKLYVNEKIWEENKLVKNAIQETRQELRMVLSSYEEYKAKFPPEVRSNMPIFTKIENAVYTKKKHLDHFLELEAEFEKEIKKTREAKFVIAGQAHEGTILEMEGCRWMANDQRNITVRKQCDDVEIINN